MDVQDIDDVDQDVLKVTTGTAVTCSKSLEQNNKTTKDEEYIVIDPGSSESSSSDESDVEVINHYKLEDVRQVIGSFGK